MGNTNRSLNFSTGKNADNSQQIQPRQAVAWPCHQNKHTGFLSAVWITPAQNYLYLLSALPTHNTWPRLGLWRFFLPWNHLRHSFPQTGSIRLSAAPYWQFQVAKWEHFPQMWHPFPLGAELVFFMTPVTPGLWCPSVRTGKDHWGIMGLKTKIRITKYSQY